VLPAVIVLLGVSALLPARFTGGLGWLASPVEAALAPVSAPMRWLTGALLPASEIRNESEALRELNRQVETLTQQHLRDEQEIERLKREMEEALLVKILNPSTPVRQLTVPVIGSSSDLSSGMITVRAGSGQGVAPGTVVVTPSLQLVGRVVAADSRTCTVQPITSKSAMNTLLAVVMTDNVASRPLAILSPTGDGRLRGPVQEEGESGVEIKRGMVVRLDDPDRWPRHSQKLVVGVVEDVGPSPEQPLRRVITVRPTARLERLSEVVLRVPDEPGAMLGSAGTGEGGR